MTDMIYERIGSALAVAVCAVAFSQADAATTAASTNAGPATASRADTRAAKKNKGASFDPKTYLAELSAEGRITGLDWLSGFSWRTGMRGLLVIEESYRLEKLGRGVEVTHRLDCRGFFSWLGYPFLRRACSVFLHRSNAALEKHFRRTTVQSRYARPSGRRA